MSNICAVIVTFNPEISLITNIEKLLPQVDQVILVDNCSQRRCQNHLEGIARLSGVRLIENAENQGIGAALNIGVKEAIRDGFTWVATFDQDSTVTTNFMEGMLDAYHSCGFQEKVALVSPVFLDPKIGIVRHAHKISSDKPAQKFAIIKNTITSGNLIKTSVFVKVGFYRENFFMDYVDTDFNLRLFKNGYQIIESCQSVLYHNLGNSQKRSFLGRRITVTNHSPARRYFKARNRIVVIRNNLFDFPTFALQDSLKFFKDILKVVFYEKDVLKKLRAMAKGTLHGLTNQMENDNFTV